MYFKGGSLLVVFGGPRVLRNTTHAPTGDSNNNIDSTTSHHRIAPHGTESTFHHFLKNCF